MKRANKYLSLALALIMALSLCVTSFAANDGTIELTNPVEGQTYTLYKIFDATLANAGANASYTVEATSPWYTAANAKTEWFVLEQADADTYYVSLVTENAPTGADLAEWMKGVIAANSTITGTPIVYDNETVTEVKWTALPYGYYFVDSSIGSICSITTTVPNAEVVDKNSFPTLTKDVLEGTAWGDEASATVGTNVNFKLVVNTGSNTAATANGVDHDFVITDTLPAEMTYVYNEEVVDGLTVDGITSGYSATWDNTTKKLVITIDDATLATLGQNEDIVITYFASLDANANPDTEYVNTAKLVYDTYETEVVDARVYTYQFEVIKTNANAEQLTGAQFELWTASEGGEKINLVLEAETGAYRVATPAEANAEGFTSAVITAGKVKVEGLDKGTYYLEEIKAPDGYNALAGRQAVDLTNGSLVSAVNEETQELEGGVQVINQSGAILPGTGGVGTTMFYVLGSVMMIGAAVLLVTKKKMANEQ